MRSKIASGDRIERDGDLVIRIERKKVIKFASGSLRTKEPSVGSEAVPVSAYSPGHRVCPQWHIDRWIGTSTDENVNPLRGRPLELEKVVLASGRFDRKRCQRFRGLLTDWLTLFCGA